MATTQQGHGFSMAITWQQQGNDMAIASSSSSSSSSPSTPSCSSSSPCSSWCSSPLLLLLLVLILGLVLVVLPPSHVCPPPSLPLLIPLRLPSSCLSPPSSVAFPRSFGTGLCSRRIPWALRCESRAGPCGLRPPRCCVGLALAWHPTCAHIVPCWQARALAPPGVWIRLTNAYAEKKPHH